LELVAWRARYSEEVPRDGESRMIYPRSTNSVVDVLMFGKSKK